MKSAFWIFISGFNFFQKHIDFSAFCISNLVSIKISFYVDDDNLKYVYISSNSSQWQNNTIFVWFTLFIKQFY